MESIIAALSLKGLVGTLVYSVLGTVMFIVSFYVLDKITPYSLHKEIGDDHNVAAGLIVAAYLIGIAIIIAAAITG